MGVFSRFLDIVNSNINALLDQAEDPEKMIKLMINEMEDTIIEIKTNCANAIGNNKAASRKIEELEALALRWQNRAELAISKGRDDLAKEALLEKKKIMQELDELKVEQGKYEQLVSKYKEEVAKLEEKLSSAKAKYQAMREQSAAKAEQAAKAKNSASKNEDPLDRFTRMEERIDRMKARKEQEMDAQDVESRFKDLEELDEIEKELQALKDKVGK